MLKFMKNTQKITPERLQKQKELFEFNKACYHGFPAKPSALAWDPQLRLLALATKTAEIRIYGIPGVEIYGHHDNSEASVTHLTFLNGQCRLVSLCEDNSLHLWQLTPQEESSGMQLVQTNSTALEGKLKKISVVVADSSGEHLMVGTEGGNIYLLNLSTFAMSDNIIYQDVVMQNVPEDYKVNPGPVEAIAEHPTEPDKVLIGYQRGLIVLWDKKNLCADQTYVCSQQLESVCWHADGSQFTTSHNDGSYMVWSSTESANPSDGPHTVYGPFPCKPITKILRPCSKSGDLIVFCGGMPRASYGDRNTVTVICGEYHVTFNITSKIIDYTVVDDDEAGHASCLVVLAEEEIVFIDLDSEEWPAFSSPYLSCLHSSAVTCSFLASSVSADIYDKIKEAGEKQQGGLSKRPWPINGGKLKNTDAPNQRDILLTGHEDGTVQFWDASGVSLTLLYKLVTAQLFVSEDLGGDGAAADDDDWPPFRKTGLFDPYSDDPRLGVKKMEMCPYTGMLVVAGTAGQILILNLEMEEKEIVPECVNVNVVAETDNFVWKSHNKLDMQTEAVKFGAGMQPTVVVQFYPPASCTSLTLHSEWGLVACGTAHGFALFDIIQKKNILSKSTLSPLDLANAADEGPMSRRKSLKKSLRESFRRLRRGRSQRKTGKTIATSPTSPGEDESEEGEEEEFDMSDEGEGEEEEEEAGKDDNGEKEYSVMVQTLEEVPLEQSADPPPLGAAESGPVEALPDIKVLPAVVVAPVVEADIQVADKEPQVEEDNIEIEDDLDGKHVLNNPWHGIKKEESIVEKTGVSEQVPFFYYVTPKIFRETTKQAPEKERKESKVKLKKEEETESVEDSKEKRKFKLKQVFTRKEKIGSIDEQTEDEHDDECKLKKEEETESVEDGKGKSKFRLNQVFSRKEKIGSGSVDEQTEDEHDNECKLKKEEETESVEDGKGKSKFRLSQVFFRKEKIGSVDEQTEDEHDNECKLKKEEETESVEDGKGKSKFRLTQVFSRKEKIGSGSIDEQTEDECDNECKLKKEEETESVEDGKGKNKFRLTQVFSRKEKIGSGSIDEQTEDEHDNECKLKKEEETESVEDGKGKSKFRLTRVFSRKEKIGSGSIDEQTEDEHDECKLKKEEETESVEDGKGKNKFRLTQVFSRKEKIGSIDEPTEVEHDNESKLKKKETKIGSVDEPTEVEHDNESKLKKEEETESVEDSKGKTKFKLTQVFSRKEKIGSGSVDEQTEDEHDECKLKNEEETESVEDGKGKSKFRLTRVFSRKEKMGSGSIDEQTEDEHDNECKLKEEEETESVEDGKGKSKFRLAQVFSRKEKIISIDEQTEHEPHHEYIEQQQRNPGLFQKIFSRQVTEQEEVMDVGERPASDVSTPKGVHRLKDWLQKREEEDEMTKVEGVEQTESKDGSLRRLFRRSRPPTLDSPLEEEVQKSSRKKSPMEPSLSKHQRLKFAFKQRSQSEEALPPLETGQIYTIEEAQVKSRSLTRPSKLWLTSHSQSERQPSPITSETSPVQTDAPDPNVTSALSKGEHEPKKRTFFTLPLKGLKSRQESQSELLKRIPSDIYNVDDKDVIHRTPSYERAISEDIIKSKISKENSSDSEGGTGKFKHFFKQRSEVILRPFNRRNKNPENRKSAPIPDVSQTEENVEVPDIEARHPSISTYIDDTPTSATSAVLPEIPPGTLSPKPSHPSQPQQVCEALSPEQLLTPDSEADSVVLDLRSLQSTPDIVRKVPDSRGSTLERTFSRRLTFSLPFGSAGGGGAMSAEEEGIKPVERSIEARSQTSDYIGSMVRCLHLTKCFIANTQVMSATLWAGTNSGAIFVFTIAIPPSEKRGDITLTVQLGKEIHLKHGAPVISVRILDGASRPFPEPMAVKKDAAPAHNSNQPHRVLICSEEQFKVFTLPQLKPFCKFKLTAHEGSRVRKIGYSNFVSSVDSTYTEAGFTVITNLGDFNVFSVPDCRRQIQETYIKKEDISGINSVVFSNRGEALYMMSPCELERVSLSARHVTRASGTVPVLIKPKPAAEEVKEESPKIKPNDEPTQDEDRDAPTSQDTAAEAPAVPPTIERETENESNKDKEEKEEKDERDTTEAVGGSIKKLEDVKENGDSSVLSGDITIDSIRDHMDDLKVCEKSDKTTELMMDGGNNGRTVLTSSTSTMKQESSSSVTVVKSTTITSVSSSSQESSSVQVVETASTEMNHSTLNGTE